METIKDVTITVKEGDLEMVRGKALTVVRVKGVDKITLRTSEMETLAEMIRVGKEEAAKP